MKCGECQSSNIKNITYVEHKTSGAYYYRCLDCLKDNWLYLSSEMTTSADVVIVMGSHKKKVYKDELNKSLCPVCDSETHIDMKADHFKDELPLIHPMRLSCAKKGCDFVMNMIFYNSPKSYFTHAIGLAKSVVKVSSEASIVLAVSSLEVYLEKAFYFSNEKNRFLCIERKINFQNIKDVKKSYKNLVNIDLPNLVDNRIWESISNLIKVRHRIVHNGGFDKYYDQIEIAENEAESAINDIQKFVSELDNKMSMECYI